MKYIQSTSKKKEKGCIFCSASKSSPKSDAKNLVVFRGKRCFTMLNKFPYNNGHIMVVPYKHTGKFERLDKETIAELMRTAQAWTQVMQPVFRADGWNIGMNIGRSAGAGIAQHIHLHILPRWNGDTNYSMTIGEVKVISQSLEEVYAQLTALVKNNPDIFNPLK